MSDRVIGTCAIVCIVLGLICWFFAIFGPLIWPNL